MTGRTGRRRLFIFTILMAGICFLTGYLISSQTPKIQSWILLKIEKASRENLPVRILPASVDVNFFPLGTTLKNVKILPKSRLKDYIDPLIVNELQASLSLWRLMRGEVQITSLSLKGSSISVRVPRPPEGSRTPPLKGLFDLLARFPLSQLSLSEVNVHAQIADPRLDVEINDLHLILGKVSGSDPGQSPSVNVEVPQATTLVRDFDFGVPRAVLVSVEGQLVADHESVVVPHLRIRRANSYFTGKGAMKGDTEALQFNELDIVGQSELQLDSLHRLLKKSLPRLANAPSVTGHAFIDVKYTQKPGVKPVAEFELRTDRLKIDRLFLDRIATKGSFRNGVVRLPQVALDHPAGSAQATETEIRIGQKTSVTTRIDARNFQLHELLKSLGVGEVPVYLQFGMQAPCSGELTPAFILTCRGTAKGENLLVRPGTGDRGVIVALRSFDVEGEVAVDGEKVTYKTDLVMSHSKGRSQGMIGYKTGFKINYEADHLASGDISSLAGLKLEGGMKIKGSTEGSSAYGTIDMQIAGNDLWLEDFWLGDARSKVSYKEGTLRFSDLQGNYAVSRYNGDVQLSLKSPNRISVNGRVPFFDMRDLMKVFSRKVHLPFPVSGTGQAQISLSGPLRFNQLTYQLKSSLFRGSAAGENFERAYFDVKAVDGEVKTERVQIHKGGAMISLSGSGHPDGTINTVIRGRELKIEDLTAVSSTGLDLSGTLDFDMDLNGPVLSPKTDLKGTLTKTSIGEQLMPDSTFRMKFTPSTIEGGGVFLGDVVKTDFVLPLSGDAPFLLKLSTQNWNFAPFFAAVSDDESRKEFTGLLSASIDLSSDSGGFWNANGRAEISDFSLSRGTLHLKSDGPLLFTMDRGFIRAPKASFIGDNTFMRITDSAQPISKLDLQVNGKLDLSLLALLAPFFEDLRGILSFAFNIRSGNAPTELLGSAYIEKGYLKFFDFPHAFEDLRIDLIFNQKRILLNTIKSDFGGGRLAGSGNIEFKGYKDFPVNVTGTFENVTLNVPDKMKTAGSGQVSLTGNWFPFLLKGSYAVKNGMITKEFGGESAAASADIRRDYFLPELLLRNNFIPLLIDFDIDFKNGIEVKNELMEGTVLGSLAVKGNPANPSVLGTVTTGKESKIFFKDAVFEVISANIRLNDPNEINPRLFVTARSRIQDHDINLVVQGTGTKPDLQLSSVPPLPYKDIISLLALGATDSQLSDSISSGQQASSTGLQIGSGIIKKNPISDVLKNKFGVDVQFSAGFDDAQAAVQKVIVSRQFSQKVDISASQSFGKAKETEAKVRYRLNDRFSLIGSWNGREYEETGEAAAQTDKNPNKVGLDVEYKFEFK